MNRFRKIIRAVLLTLLLVVVVAPAALYLVLATPPVQDFLRREANSRLSGLLGTRVEIDRVRYRPFNAISITGIHIDDTAGRPALEAAAVSARFELWHFIRTGRILIDYAVIDAPQIALYRATPESPLNIGHILRNLKSDRHDSNATSLDLKIGTAIIRGGHISYNVLSQPAKDTGLDPNHIDISELDIYAYLRQITDDTYDIELESLNLRERSGLALTDLHAHVKATPSMLELDSPSVRMPGSSIKFNGIKLPINGYDNIRSALETIPITVRTRGEAEVALRDLAWIVPALSASDRTVTFDLDLYGSLRRLRLNHLDMHDDQGLTLTAEGSAHGFTSPDSLRFHIERLEITSPGTELARFIEPFNSKTAGYVARCGSTSLTVRAHGTLHDIDARLNLNTAGGSIMADGRLTRQKDGSQRMNASGKIDIETIEPGRVFALPDLGSVSLSAQGDLTFGAGRSAEADFSANLKKVQFKGYTYSDIDADAVISKGRADIDIESRDPNATFSISAGGSSLHGDNAMQISADIAALRPNTLNLTAARSGYTLSGHAEIDLNAHDIDDIAGFIRLSDIAFLPADNTGGEPLHINRFDVDLLRNQVPQQITVTSDFLNGQIDGQVTPSTLAATFRDMAAHVVPALFPHDRHLHKQISDSDRSNDFTFSFTLANAESLSRFLNLPVQVIYPVTFDGMVSSPGGSAHAMIDAPYLQQGDKIIESTVIQASVNSDDDHAGIYAATRFPTKKGPMTAVIDVSGADSRFDTDIDWVIDRKIPLNGQINFSTGFRRGGHGDICADTYFNPGEITFGDDVWRIAPSTLRWCDRRLTADGFALTSDTQKIAVDGVAGPDPDDLITVNLTNIALAAIFETLEIDKALIGGRATGTFTASQALSGAPLLATDNLHVNDIGYNYCTLGDADVKAHFDADRKSFFLDADIVNPEGEHSRIWGDIFAASESLDLNFDAHNVKVGFMKPFMEAFTSDVDGFVSGRARLFGTFKDIDMDADIFARDLRLKIDFTNTWYTATDSIHVRPGLIDLKDITIRDVNGHTAKLNGWLRHDFFHNPTFDFHITDARDFLSYNVTQKINPEWYGTVYGNGSATITGKPGVVEIGVDMSTAPGSTFTFELSDRLEAEQYSFITFRDRTETTVADTLLTLPDDIPEAVKDFQARMLAKNTDAPSQYLMDIHVDITPDARMIIVMDPVGGDRIKANGAGDLRLTYNSADNDLRMYGSYTLERGSYNFTLQDIIIKDFTIDQGSSITFRGDPYSAQLNIDAVYSVNANLSDLDESFLQDKDLNRTNVPVQALLRVTGDMRQPDIAFDLRFPTLTSDIYRKVRSIISTEEMMNRQIIYLLALNRFYTPDYMTATRGSELFSVASSTISSQLSNMLGKLSENWSIAPNLRSDRGDFSDVEVDVALSSRLLNNRLLFNGNFGYRDRSLNTNQFIGDFDIEYLLNPRGTWRLKAYNRYNDQNYYVRSAATTQGVGIMFRRDFDTIFRHRPKKSEAGADTTSAVTRTTNPDSIHSSTR